MILLPTAEFAMSRKMYGEMSTEIIYTYIWPIRIENPKPYFCETSHGKSATDPLDFLICSFKSLFFTHFIASPNGLTRLSAWSCACWACLIRYAKHWQPKAVLCFVVLGTVDEALKLLFYYYSMHCRKLGNRTLGNTREQLILHKARN